MYVYIYIFLYMMLEYGSDVLAALVYIGMQKA